MADEKTEVEATPHQAVIDREDPEPKLPDDDPDTLEAAAAMEALEAEGGTIGDDGTPAEGGDIPPAAAEPAKTEPKPSEAAPKASPAAAADETGAQPTTVPHARFNEVNERLRESDSRLRESELERARLEGALAATQGQGTKPNGGAPAAPKEPTVPEALAAIETRKQALSEKFDDGEITMAEFQKQLTPLNNAEREVHSAGQAPQAAAPSSGKSLADEQILATQEQNLNAAHGYIATMTERDITSLTDMAYTAAEREGVVLGQDNQSTYWLREKVAELSDSFGPIWYPKFEPAVGQQPPQEQTPTGEGEGDGKPTISPAAAARAAALAKADAHPPNTNDLGRTAADDLGITDEQILAMSDPELENADPRVLARYSEIAS